MGNGSLCLLVDNYELNVNNYKYKAIGRYVFSV